MNGVSRRLYKVRRSNVDGQWFVPRPDLDGIFNRNTISEIVSKGELSPYRNDAALAVSSLPGQVDRIHRKAKVALAVLCYLGLEYIGYIFHLESYGDSAGIHIDDHLPLTIESLISCNLRKHHATAFERTQWHFITTRIRLGIAVVHNFRPEIILPITSCQPGRRLTEEGAFGAVTEIKVEPGHQVEPVYSGNVSCMAFNPHCQIKRLRICSDCPETLPFSREEASV